MAFYIYGTICIDVDVIIIMFTILSLCAFPSLPPLFVSFSVSRSFQVSVCLFFFGHLSRCFCHSAMPLCEMGLSHFLWHRYLQSHCCLLQRGGYWPWKRVLLFRTPEDLGVGNRTVVITDPVIWTFNILHLTQEWTQGQYGSLPYKKCWGSMNHPVVYNIICVLAFSLILGISRYRVRVGACVFSLYEAICDDRLGKLACRNLPLIIDLIDPPMADYQ